MYIEQYLKGNDLKSVAVLLPKINVVDKRTVPARSMEEQIAGRIDSPKISLEKSGSFHGVELTLTENQAQQRQTAGCLVDAA